MSASPEFYKPAAAFQSPLPGPGAAADDDDYNYSSSCCRTPTGSGISYLKEPTTCPPAPRKPSSCKKRLFNLQQEEQEHQQQQLISLRLDELERIFRLQPSKCDKRRRSGSARKSPTPSQNMQLQSLKLSSAAS